jgi:hypothetical protein
VNGFAKPEASTPPFGRGSWALILLMFACLALAQDQTGNVDGVVVDAVTHQPVRKATVSLNLRSGMGARPQNAGPKSATTDATGSFSLSSLDPGQYQLMVLHPNYPQSQNAVRKIVEIKAGEKAAPVNIELIPAASVTGHVVDEDGDPMSGCIVQAAQQRNSGQNFFMTNAQTSPEDGSYRIHGMAPGKYLLYATCRQPAFQPRPFSAGPELPPVAAYPTQYYPATGDAKSAELVELFPGVERAGVEFRMRPSPVTQINGTFASGFDARIRQFLNVQLTPIEGRQPWIGLTNAVVDPENPTFRFPQVFPGSYILVAFAGGENAVGAGQRVEVKDTPIEVAVDLRPGMKVEGTVEIEGNPSGATQPLTPNQVHIMLSPENLAGQPVPNVQANADGTFTLASVLPGRWRLIVNAPRAFLKSAWLGTTEVTDGKIDVSSGAAGALKVQVSTNTATIRGAGPAGQTIFAQEVSDFPYPNSHATSVDQSGQFKLEGLAPGKYRIAASETEGPPPEDAGQEIMLHEGETAMVEVKARSN